MFRLSFASACALLMTALLAMPPAAAQLCTGGPNLTCQTTTEIAIRPLEAPVMPDAGHVALPMTIAYTHPATSLSTSSTAINLRVAHAPPWVVATISPSTVYVPVDQTSDLSGGAQRKTTQAFLLVSTTPDAPAFTADQLEISATAHANGNLAPSSTVTSIPVQAAFFALTDVRTFAREVDLQGAKQDLHMEVRNLGNGPVRLEFLVESWPEGLAITPPAPIVLESKQQGAEQVSAAVAWRLEPRGSFGEADVVLVIRSTYALDNQVTGDLVRIPLHVDGGGGAGDVIAQGLLAPYGGAPAPITLGLLAAGLAATVLVERQRRRQAGPPREPPN